MSSSVMASAASRRSRIGDSRRPATNQPTNPIAASTRIAAIEYVAIAAVTGLSSAPRSIART